MFKCIHDNAPKYLAELIVVDQLPDCIVKGPQTLVEFIPWFPGLKWYMSPLFCSIGPRIWNNLPETVVKSTSLSAFKSQLKKLFYLNIAII